MWRGDVAAVSDALARGADPDAPDRDGRTAWFWAITAHDRPMVELLLARAPRLADRLATRVALRMAAARDEPWLVDSLIARGVSIDGAVDQRASPLLVAAENAAVAAMQRLVVAGANVDLADPEGDTPLAAAVRAGCDACVDLLIAHHVKLAGAAGESHSAVWWARRTGQAALAERLVTAGAPDEVVPDGGAQDAASAVARALPLLQRGVASWQADGECLACHHHPMAIRAIALAERAGVTVDREIARSTIDAVRGDDKRFADAATAAFARPDNVLRLSMDPAGDAAFGNAWFLAAELDAKLPAGPDQQVLATFQARMQQADGRWRAGPLRGVIECSDIAATALAVQVILGYGDAEARVALAAAAHWLASEQPVTLVDHVYRMRGLHDLGGDAAAEVTALRALQHTDGSWSHIPGPGDAYSTGLAVVALIEAGGVAPDDSAIARAATYLLRTQDADGSWLVPSRAPALLPYHDRGFPHGKLQFVSFAGTAWATMALIYSTKR